MKLETQTVYLNLDELAEKVGRKKDTIRRVLRKQHRPSVALAEQLAANGISPRRFLKPLRGWRK